MPAPVWLIMATLPGTHLTVKQNYGPWKGYWTLYCQTPDLPIVLRWLYIWFFLVVQLDSCPFSRWGIMDVQVVQTISMAGHTIKYSGIYMGHILTYLGHIWDTSETYVGHIWNISWTYLGHIRNIYRLKDIWYAFSSLY